MGDTGRGLGEALKGMSLASAMPVGEDVGTNIVS